MWKESGKCLPSPRSTLAHRNKRTWMKPWEKWQSGMSMDTTADQQQSKHVSRMLPQLSFALCTVLLQTQLEIGLQEDSLLCCCTNLSCCSSVWFERAPRTPWRNTKLSLPTHQNKGVPVGQRQVWALWNGLPWGWWGWGGIACAAKATIPLQCVRSICSLHQANTKAMYHSSHLLASPPTWQHMQMLPQAYPSVFCLQELSFTCRHVTTLA